MVIGRETELAKFEYVGMIRRSDSEMWIKADCPPGRYLIYVKSNFKKFNKNTLKVNYSLNL